MTSEKLKCCKDSKSIIIAVLTVLCIIFAAMAFTGADGSSSAPVDLSSAPVASSVTASAEKLPPSALMQKAAIEGISLATPLSDIEAAAKEAGFTCETSGDAKASASWTCKHGQLKDTNLRINSEAGKITRIYRNGAIDTDDITPTMNMIDDMKFLLNTRENVRFSQNENSLSLSFRDGDNKVDYTVSRRRERNREKPEEVTFTQNYTAVIEYRRPVETAPASAPVEQAAPVAVEPTPTEAAAAETAPAEPAKEEVPKEETATEETAPAALAAPEATPAKAVSEEEAASEATEE